MAVPADFRYTGFYDLLADAVFQHRLAAKCTESYSMNRHARASVMASALSVECAANCLLNSLDLPSALLNDLDKISALSKIDSAIRLRSDSKLDRGRNEVQKIAELIKARNDYVHPRATNIKADVALPEDAGENWLLPMSLDGEHWPAIGIPKKAMLWSEDSSLATLKAVAAFFKYVFVEVLDASMDELHSMLPSVMQMGDVQILAIFEEFRSELKSANEFGIDLSFFGVYESGSTKA